VRQLIGELNGIIGVTKYMTLQAVNGIVTSKAQCLDLCQYVQL